MDDNNSENQNIIKIDKNIIKSIQDKSLDERKKGIKKLENFLKEIIPKYSINSLKIYLSEFKSFTDQSNSLTIRKCGFSCFLAFINALHETKQKEELLKIIMQYINENLSDKNPLTISAAECVNNIMIYFKDYVLLNFDNFLDSYLILVNVNEPESKNLADNLDNSLKGIINYALEGNLPNSFNLMNFFMSFINKIKIESVRFKIISWINIINQIPEINLINFLNLFIGDIFDALKDKNINEENNKITVNCLNDFKEEIDKNFENLNYEIEVKILEILIKKANENIENNEIKVLIIIFEWIDLFLLKYIEIFNKISKNNQNQNENLNNIIDNNNKIENNDNLNIINTSLDNENNLNYAKSNIENDRKFPFHLFSEILDIVFKTLQKFENKNSNLKDLDSKKVEEIIKISNKFNNSLLNIIEYSEYNLNLRSFETILIKNFQQDNLSLNLIFKWISSLINKYKQEAFSNFNDFLDKLLIFINVKDDEIFHKLLQTLCEFTKFKEENIDIIIYNLLLKLKDSKNEIMENRGELIVNFLCSNLNIKKVFESFADQLFKIEDKIFVGKIIKYLYIYLLTIKDTENLNKLLKILKKNSKDFDKNFFEKIFKIWCINPISCLILCLIAEYFELSYNLLMKLGEFKLKKEYYLELSHLVRLLESSSFINIRIYLLEPIKNKYLVKTLYGILLILPQSKSYEALLKRLKPMEMILKLDRKKFNIKIDDNNNNNINESDEEEIKKYLNIFEEIHKNNNDICEIIDDEEIEEEDEKIIM